MNRDNIIGLLLIAAILIGYSIWMAPSEEEQALARHRQDSIAEVQRMASEADADRLRLLQQEQSENEELALEAADLDTAIADSIRVSSIQDRMGLFTNAAMGSEQLVTFENDLMILRINTHGGHIESVTLKDYKTYDQQPLELLTSEEDIFTFHFFAGNRQISTNQLFFSPEHNGLPYGEEESIAVSQDDTGTLLMRAYSNTHAETNPSYIEFSYQLTGNKYMLDFAVNFVGMQDIIAANTTIINLDWRSKLPRQEKNRSNEQNNSTIFYKYTNDEVSKLRETKDGSERLLSSVNWISFKQQFFSCVLISENGFANADISTTTSGEEEDDFLKTMTASIILPYDAREDNTYPMRMYYGPNHYQIMRSYDLDLERQIPLGWGFFIMSWINRYAVIPIFNFLNGFNLNYGIIILILTILLKIFLMPIAYKTYKSQAKMRVLKPEIEELGKKFPKKEDAMKKQQATMALYKKAGVNPMAGCIPMLLQLPILLALFRFFPASIELRQEAFLWADDLSSYDSILDLPFTIPFYGDHVSLFTILMTVSTILYTRMNNQMMASTSQMPGMKTMMYFMPVMLMGIFNNFASGLSYYYFLANIITFGQMYLFRLFVDEDALHRKIEENKKKPVKKSKWAERMEALAKQQDAQKKRKK
jgi:YidC/Oxa1 family membrane protein insertase